jgi:hypothetical protein
MSKLAEPPCDSVSWHRVDPSEPANEIYTKLALPKTLNEFRFSSPGITKEQQLLDFAAGTGLQPGALTAWSSESSINGISNYQYWGQVSDRPLEIRVVDIMPAKSFDDELVCYLRTVSLAQKPYYEALSYTWGDSADRRQIKLNDKPFAVTANLWTALLYLRSCSEVRSIWIDALSINQSDLIERNFMVSQMHTIYNRAQKTIAWLGEATEKSNEAIRFFNQRSKDGAPFCSMLHPNVFHGRAINKEPIPENELKIWEALADFFGRPWWTRAWVVQEVGCAHHWEIQCGTTTFNGVQLPTIMFDIMKAREQTFALPLHLSFLIDNFFGISQMQFLEPVGLGPILAINRHRDAKDDRDKVYAFANMVCPPIPELYPNYEESVEELYYRTALQLIKYGKDLRFLALCETQSQETLDRLTKFDGLPRKNIPGLPSWVPNWANQRFASPLLGGYETMLRSDTSRHFNASGDMKPVVKIYGNSLAESRGNISVRGVIIDTVADVGRDCYGEALHTFFRSVGEFYGKRVTSTPEDSNIDDILFRIVTVDGVENDRLPFLEIPKGPDKLLRTIHDATVGRQLFMTDSGMIGLGPRGLQKNDKLVIVLGCHVPLILRTAWYFTNLKGYVKCHAHEVVETCCGLGCAKSTKVLEPKYNLIGEACE